MTKFMALIAVLTLSSFASAETMNCYMGLDRAKDMKETSDRMTMGEVVSIEIEDGEGEKSFELNGEPIIIQLWKKEHAPVYRMSMVLMKREEDHKEGHPWIGSIDDWLAYEGPSQNDGLAPDGEPGASRYGYLNRSVGTLMITPVLYRALVGADMWDEPPFTSSFMDVTEVGHVRDAVLKLLKDKKLDPTDLVMMYTAHACTKNP